MKMKQIWMPHSSLISYIEDFQMSAKYRIALAVIILIAAPYCRATSLDLWDLKTSFISAAIVAKVDISNIEALKFDGTNSEICGYRINARVIELFKGKNIINEFTFFSATNEDILEGHTRYFVLVNPRASPASQTTFQGKKCDTRGIRYAVSGAFQTVFPLRENSDSQIPDDLMVSRHSPFTTGNSVGIFDYIIGFIIENNRIYALASWKRVAADLQAWKENPPTLPQEE